MRTNLHKQQILIKDFFQQKTSSHHYVFIIAQLWLTSHSRSTVVLLDTGTPGTSREISSEDADGETQTQPLGYKPRALAIELTSSKAIAGKELSLSSWCHYQINLYQNWTIFIRM